MNKYIWYVPDTDELVELALKPNEGDEEKPHQPKLVTASGEMFYEFKQDYYYVGEL